MISDPGVRVQGLIMPNDANSAPKPAGTSGSAGATGAAKPKETSP
jgi:hypothetical protein